MTQAIIGRAPADPGLAVAAKTGALRATTPALEASGLSKRFGGLAVTSDVSLRLAPGARTALIGPNGAGKTTLVHLLSGILEPDAGSISIFGMNVTKAPAHVRARHGLVRTFQITSLFANLTVLENLYLALIQRSGHAFRFWNSAERQRDVLERAEQIMQHLRLTEDAHHRVGEIAYGKQRLVELGIALALEPKVLLLDEPAAGIPSTELDLLLDAMAGLPKDIAVLMIEHDMEMVRRFATEVVVLVHGKVLISGLPDEVMSDAEVRRVYLGSSGTKRYEGRTSHA